MMSLVSVPYPRFQMIFPQKQQLKKLPHQKHSILGKHKQVIAGFACYTQGTICLVIY